MQASSEGSNLLSWPQGSWGWFCVCDGAELEQFGEGQLPGPAWYRKDVRGRHGFPAEGSFIFS